MQINEYYQDTEIILDCAVASSSGTAGRTFNHPEWTELIPQIL